MAFFKPIMTTNKNNIEKHLGQLVFDTTENQIYIDIDDNTRKVVEVKIDNKTAKAYIDDSISASETLINTSIGTLETNMNTKIENVKNNIQVKSFTLNKADWSKNTVTNLYEATLTDDSITSNDMADISIDNTTYQIAVDAIVKPYTTESAGSITLFAEKQPTNTISGKYMINRGAANG